MAARSPALAAPIALRFAAVASVCIVCDQAAKASVAQAMAEGTRHAILGGFLELVHVRNPGAAFGWFADLPLELRVPLFAAVFALAAFVVLSMLRRVAPGERGAPAWTFALAAVLGGAASNLIDRLVPSRGGAVIDYIHVRLWSGYAWPDFNLADACIALGLAGVLVLLSAREGEARALAEPAAGESNVDAGDRDRSA